jgi:hypothetical protein
MVLPGYVQLLDIFTGNLIEGREAGSRWITPPNGPPTPILARPRAEGCAKTNNNEKQVLYRVIDTASGYSEPASATTCCSDAGRLPLNRPEASMSGAPVGLSIVTLGMPPSTCQAGPLEWDVQILPARSISNSRV